MHSGVAMGDGIHHRFTQGFQGEFGFGFGCEAPDVVGNTQMEV